VLSGVPITLTSAVNTARGSFFGAPGSKTRSKTSGTESFRV